MQAAGIGPKHDKKLSAVASVLYVNVLLALAYVLWAYTDLAVRLHCRFGMQAAALRQLGTPSQGSEASSSGSAVMTSELVSARATIRRLDMRLSLYLLAFLVAQLPSVLHRSIQICVGDVSAWLAVAQAATQPAQGLLNALVYLRYNGKNNWSFWCHNCKRRMRWRQQIGSSSILDSLGAPLDST